MAVIQGIARSVRRQRGTYLSSVYLRLIVAAAISRVLLLIDMVVCYYLNSKPLRQDRITTFNVRLRRLRGSPVKLDDGSIVNRSDFILEIHLNMCPI